MPNKQFLIPTESAPGSSGGGGGSTGSVLLESSVTSTKISALPTGSPAQLTDLIPIARGSNNDSLSVANILATPLANPVLVAHTLSENIGSSPSSITSSAINTSTSTLLIVSGYNFSNVAMTVTDSKSNSWVSLPQFGASGAAGGVIVFYCASPVVGAGHTFTITGGTYVGVAVAAFSGITVTRAVGVGPMLVAAASTGTIGNVNTASTTIQTVPLSGPAGSLLYSSIVIGNGVQTLSVNSGFTIIDQATGSMELSHAWVQAADSGDYSPTWSSSDSTNKCSSLSSFMA